jgi:hypothetical protein
MIDPIGELDREQEELTWEILYEKAGLEGSISTPSIAAIDLFASRLPEEMAKHFLVCVRNEKRWDFVTSDQLNEIVSEPMMPGRVRLETNLDEVAAVYVFVSVVQREVLKVGEAEDLRVRIANGHLRYGSAESELRGHCLRYTEHWPECIRVEEITMLAFPMRGCCKSHRCFIEAGLQALLHPRMG